MFNCTGHTVASFLFKKIKLAQQIQLKFSAALDIQNLFKSSPLEMTTLPTTTGSGSVDHSTHGTGSNANLQNKTELLGTGTEKLLKHTAGLKSRLYSHLYSTISFTQNALYIEKNIDTHPRACSHGSLSSRLTNSWHMSLDCLLTHLFVPCTIS